MSLTNLPLETFEHIVHYIDDAKDLLYFALINKQFAKLITQAHLQFRIIRCLTNTKFIWSKLADRPYICTRIRELHLYGRSVFHVVMDPDYPRNAIVPASFLDNDSDIKVLWPWGTGPVNWGPSIEENRTPSITAGPSARSQLRSSVEICSVEQSLKSLYNILPLMSNLTKVFLIFPVNTNPTPQTLKAVLDNLRHSCTLREIAITWEESLAKHAPDTFSSLWTFSHLTLFHFKVLFPNLSNHDVDELLRLIIDRCQNLEKLYLNFRISNNPMNLDEIWKRGNWKHLRHLHLGYYMTFVDTEDEGLFRHFMARHPGLECLEYRGPDTSSPLSHLLEANLFKNFKALNLPDIPTELSSLPPLNLELAPALQINVFEKLECLCIGSSSNALLEKSYVPSLRMLTIGSYKSNLRKGLGHYLPDTLERLCIKHRIHNGVTTRLMETLSPLRKLTHLCISTDTKFSRLPQPEMILPEISRLSSLKYFGLIYYSALRESWVRLIRDTSGEYVGYEIDTSVHSVSKCLSSTSDDGPSVLPTTMDIPGCLVMDPIILFSPTPDAGGSAPLRAHLKMAEVYNCMFKCDMHQKIIELKPRERNI